MADRLTTMASGEILPDNQMTIKVHHTPTLLNHIHIIDEVVGSSKVGNYPAKNKSQTDKKAVSEVYFT